METERNILLFMISLLLIVILYNVQLPGQKYVIRGGCICLLLNFRFLIVKDFFSSFKKGNFKLKKNSEVFMGVKLLGNLSERQISLSVYLFVSEQ